jgi:hypothetical protein
LAEAGIMTTGDSGTATVNVNDITVTMAQAVEMEDVHIVTATTTPVVVEYVATFTERWDRYNTTIPVTVRLSSGNVSVGEEGLELEISFPGGYRAGNLVHVLLPWCITTLTGGTQAFEMTLDPRGANEVRIPVKAIAPSIINADGDVGNVMIWIQVANMFEVEDAGSGEVAVTVMPA